MMRLVPSPFGPFREVNRHSDLFCTSYTLFIKYDCLGPDFPCRFHPQAPVRALERGHKYCHYFKTKTLALYNYGPGMSDLLTVRTCWIGRNGTQNIQKLFPWFVGQPRRCMTEIWKGKPGYVDWHRWSLAQIVKLFNTGRGLRDRVTVVDWLCW
jgi:hypothetical protein